jgi:hypothetical protein
MAQNIGQTTIKQAIAADERVEGATVARGHHIRVA